MKKSFTLLEFVVVISIIGVLSSIAAPSMVSFVSKSRDARRIADMRTLTVTLEQFYMNNSRYPDNGTDGISNSGEYIGDNNGPFERSIALYMKGAMPKDPKHDTSNWTTGYFYSYDPVHCWDWPIGSCNCAAAGVTGKGNAATLAFNLAETTSIDLQKAVCSGGDMNQSNADYNLAFVVDYP